MLYKKTLLCAYEICKKFVHYKLENILIKKRFQIPPFSFYFYRPRKKVLIICYLTQLSLSSRVRLRLIKAD